MIGPAVILNEFPAVREERFQIRIHRVDRATFDFVDPIQVAVEVESLVVTGRIVEHHVLVHLCADPEWLWGAECAPTHLASILQALKDHFFGS